MSDIDQIQERLREFADERDWNRYHTPKNLAMALAGEVGELLAEFQWLTEAESRSVASDEQKLAAIRDELADVTIYLFRLADILGVDLPTAADEKIERNAERFPPSVAGPGS